MRQKRFFLLLWRLLHEPVPGRRCTDIYFPGSDIFNDAEKSDGVADRNGLEILLLQLADCMIARSRREGHVGQGRIDAGGRGHA